MNLLNNVFKLIIVLVTLYSCTSGNNKKNYVEEKLYPVDSLSVFLGLPVLLNFYEDKIFVYDFFGDSTLIKVIDVSSDKEVFSFAPKGEGPEEYIFISNIYFFTDNNFNKCIGVFDQYV